MKVISFHFQSYRDLPRDFRERYESIWVTLPNELCDPAQVSRNLHWNLDELELADDLGFDGLGINEHHSNGYGHCVNPAQIGAVLARRDSDAALCFVGQTLATYDPPLRVAEETAVIDVLSRGRLVAGMPVGTPMDTTLVYGRTPTEVRPRWLEAHDLIVRAWTEPGPFAFNGKYTKLRYVNPWPTPYQKPHPPIWLAGGGSVETWEMAVEKNYTYNALSFVGYKLGQGMMQRYWRLLGERGVDDNPYRAGFCQVVLVGETDEEAERLYLDHVRDFYEQGQWIQPYQAAVPGYQTRRSVENSIRQMVTNPEARVVAAELGRHTTWKEFVDSRVIVAGSPATVVDQLKELATDLRVGHLVALTQIQSMSKDLAEHNLRLFADKVLPEIQKVWSDTDYDDPWWPQGATRNAHLVGPKLDREALAR